MATWGRVLTSGVFIGFLGLGGGADASASECGPVEDAEKASYRPLALADFEGERPREQGRPRQGGSTSILITTAVAVDALEVAVAPVGAERFRAQIRGSCVRAYFMKRLSGRKSELAVAWELAHEQGHFDLTQAHARELERALVALTAEGESAEAAERGLRERVRASYRSAVAALQREQDAYDRETRHGHHRRAQGRWSDALAARLSAARAALAGASEERAEPVLELAHAEKRMAGTGNAAEARAPQ